MIRRLDLPCCKEFVEAQSMTPDRSRRCRKVNMLLFVDLADAAGHLKVGAWAVKW